MSLISCSQSSDSKHSETNSTSKNDDVDSTMQVVNHENDLIDKSGRFKYYRAFDWFSQKGISELDSLLEYPHIKIEEKNSTTIVNCVFKGYEDPYLFENSNWESDSSHWDDSAAEWFRQKIQLKKDTVEISFFVAEGFADTIEGNWWFTDWICLTKNTIKWYELTSNNIESIPQEMNEMEVTLNEKFEFDDAISIHEILTMNKPFSWSPPFPTYNLSFDLKHNFDKMSELETQSDILCWQIFDHYLSYQSTNCSPPRKLDSDYEIELGKP
ncbi:hypothetical protein K6119_11350 [Paracrocinitomix mangrovi]|uniref:hypothetical protein n=1 Tax=Paracrocinitomix mangrovi TaxID=2862509 RepID=UPI001C8DB416|nr:hypothetical protein [Paracrocinitomix mangrovi]UKN00330.1 hypothetical protein K6119_11350 [Paracrocinitomix mangrovi]